MNINTYLGFDIGTKRTGVAIANSLTMRATGIAVIKHHKNNSTNWIALDEVINSHNIKLFIVGLPFDQQGKEQIMTFIAKSFGKKLKNRYQIEVEFIDEYLSSNEAKKLLKYNHHHHNAQRGNVDKQSSQLILQTWLNEKDLISNHIQLNDSGKLIHLLGLEGLSKQHLTHILDKADSLIDASGNLKKSKALDDMSIANLFFEPSTRTRNTFEIAAMRSSANVINVDLANSALKKNEDLLDTMRTLKAMQIDMFVIRHKQNGLPHHVAKYLKGVSILNAGDGINAHPTQALLDMLSIRQHKKTFENLSVAIVGDIIHSRVAHSGIQALKTLGTTDIRLIAPKILQYNSEPCSEVSCFDEIEPGLKDCDVVIVLRLQKERMIEANIPNEQEYFDSFGLTPKRLALTKSDSIVMHPGPINRGVEIDSIVADGNQSIILQQVTDGIAIRMAVMQILANK